MPAFPDRVLAAEALQRLTTELSHPNLTAAEAAVLRHRLMTLIDTIHGASRRDVETHTGVVAMR
jgi:hypothetical protein